jgi:hypothetical protein
VTEYDPADRRIVAVQLGPGWDRPNPTWRFVGDQAHHGRLVHRRADAKHFPSEGHARRYTQYLFADNPHLRAWRIQTLDGETVAQVAREAWENELA